MSNQNLNLNINTNTTILVTGAGGTVGREVIKLIMESYPTYKVKAFDLKTPDNVAFLDTYRDRLEVYYGDITRSEDLEDVTMDVDCCLHIASVIPPMAYEDHDLTFEVNVSGSQNLIRALEKNSPDAFVVMTSSVAVYGDRLHDPHIRVGDPLQPSYGDNYGESKVRMEELLRDCSLDHTIFRLSAIMGADNHKISKLMFYMPLETPMEITTPRDTARALVLAVQHRSELKGRTFNLGGGPSCRTIYRDLLAKNFEINGLGDLDFPDKAFAERNYHCGLYDDGDALEHILHFRRDTLDTYYAGVRAGVPAYKRLLRRPFRWLIKKYLLSKSEPYKAWKTGDKDRMKYFF